MAASDGERTGEERREHHSSAPVHSVPGERIVSIEHPCIVKNMDKGIESLGGEAQIKHVLEHKVGDALIKVGEKTHVYPEPVVGVSLRPDDVLAKKLTSSGVETRNILVRVTVPKWTGRKRKRGSDEPFALASPAEQQHTNVKASDLLRRLRDNEGAYQVQPLGMIRETHRFRSQPDYQMHSGDMPIMRELRDHIFRPTYKNLQDFTVDLNPYVRGSAAYPLPPTFTAIDQPYRYEYQQAAGVVYKFDEHGNPVCENNTITQRRILESLAPDAKAVPQGPPPGLKLLGRQDRLVLRAIEDLKQLLEKRPLVSKRVFANSLPDYREDVLKEATQWAGYSFSAGPWRDVLVKFGVDPRADPTYRFYQTVAFVTEKDSTIKSGPRDKRQIPSIAARKAGNTSHTFDGVAAPAKNRIWQICDISDPMIHGLLQTEDIRTECDVHGSGWYRASTLAKARVIMKDKMRCLILGATPPESDYIFIATMPDDVADTNAWKAHLDQLEVGPRVLEMAKEYRASATQTEKILSKRLQSSARERERGGSAQAGPSGRSSTREDEGGDGAYHGAEHGGDEGPNVGENGAAGVDAAGAEETMEDAGDGDMMPDSGAWGTLTFAGGLSSEHP